MAWLAGVLLPNAIAAQTPVRQPCERVELRLVDEAPAASTRRYANGATGRFVSLSDAILLDAHGLLTVSTTSWIDKPGDTLWTVMATARPAAADSLSAVAARHLHGSIAVLVGEKVLETSYIAGPIHRATLPLLTDVSKTAADSLVLSLRRTIDGGCSDH